MTEKSKTNTASIALSDETARQIQEIIKDFNESRSRIISRAIQMLYEDLRRRHTQKEV